MPDYDVDVETGALTPIAELGPNGRKVLQAITARMVAGAKHYAEHPGGGDFTDQRDYLTETSEELLDAVVYLEVERQRRAADIAALKAEVEYWREQAKAHCAARAAAIVEGHGK